MYEEILKDVPLPKSIKDEIKRKLEELNIDEEKAKKIVDKCVETYFKNLVEPGEASGIVAAQSIGEPGTQMSLPYEEEIIIKEGDTIRPVRIGEFVDSNIEEFGFTRIGGSEVCDLSSDVYVLSLDANGKVYWKRVIRCIRHRFKGNLIRIGTKSGRKITATPYHSFVTLKEGRIVPVMGSELRIGDKIPVLKFMPARCIKAVDLHEVQINGPFERIELDFNLGYLIGAYIARGRIDDTGIIIQGMSIDAVKSIEKILVERNLGSVEYRGDFLEINSYVLREILERFGRNPEEMILPDFVFNADIEFVKGILKGFLDFSGRSMSKEDLTLNFSSRRLMDCFAILLSRFKVFTIKTRKEKRYELTIPKEYLKILMDAIKSEYEYNETESDVVWDEIVSIEDVYYDGYVYDVSVSGLETFTTFEGVVTHNTMRTFHYAGVAEIDVTLGLPRLIEILDVRKKPSTPMMTIRLLPEYAKDKEKAREVANRIEATYIIDVADIATDIRNLRIIISPDEKALENKGLSFENLKKIVEKRIIKEKAELIEEDGKLIIQISPDVSKPYKTLMDIFEKIRKEVIAGIKEIKRVIIRKEGDEYVLYTEGSNLKKVMKVKGVDYTRTITNNIYEIYEVLGIEAARNAIIKEAIETLEEQGLEVDVRHIMLVADVMTADGELRQIGRHGVAGEKQSILARAAFEMTVNNLLEAAVKGEIDELRGITENIIVGQPIKLGTGDIELVYKGVRR